MSRELVTGFIGNIDFGMSEARETSQHEKKQYAAFEQAIDAWEKRTGLFVERSHKVGEVFTDPRGRMVAINYGTQWRNFSKFLGSREAAEYREKNGMKLSDMLKEWEQLSMNEPDIQIKDR